jgi:hypothetical protein
MRSVSYERKAGYQFFPELLVQNKNRRNKNLRNIENKLPLHQQKTMDFSMTEKRDREGTSLVSF